MSEEENEAIKRIKYNDISKPLACGDLTICNIEDLNTVLNLTQKQQEEIEKKDKIIDEMAKAMINYDCFIKECKHYAGENGKLCEDCIKEYFTLLIYTKKEV